MGLLPIKPAELMPFPTGTDSETNESRKAARDISTMLMSGVRLAESVKEGLQYLRQLLLKAKGWAIVGEA
jgi:DNA phosphorothioation-dependent restriction protein DptG